MKKNPQLNFRETLHRGRVFDFNRENVTLQNGVTVDLEIIRHPGASAVVALSTRKTVVMVRQYRYAVGDHIFEIPAGTFEETEPPLSCARRELIEETGFRARNWEGLGVITPVPGYSDEQIHLFLATELVRDAQNLDQDEIIEVVELPLTRAVEMIYSGEIRDAKSIAGLLIAAHHVNRRLRKGSP